MITQQFVINNQSGLHARPAALFVQTASKFKSSVAIQYNGKNLDGKSILSVLSGGMGRGAAIALLVEGEDEAQASDALSKLLAGGLGE